MTDLSQDQNAINGTAVTGNFTLQAQLPNGKTCSVAAYLYFGDDEDSINQRMDMYAKCLERQRKIAEIPELEVKMEQLERALQQQQDAYDVLMNKSQNGKRITSQEEAALSNYPVNIQKINEEIARGQLEIERAKKVVA